VGDECDADFIPRLKLKAKDKFKATGGEKHMQKVEKDTNYMFCPLPHQLPIICLVCKHFCQHPILPECHGQAHTPSQIHHDAVPEAYYHCKVWGYLWMNWYMMDKWVLWAQLSHGHTIPWKRMMMLVESLWRNFKQMVLHYYNCPWVDFVTYTLVIQGIAPYWVCFNQIIKNPWDGHARHLCGERIPIKHVWLTLCQCPIRGLYNTDIKHWLCQCGAQKYHSYLLCKHVQALPLPSADWWTTVVWWHTAPFYNICKLLPESEQVTAPVPAALGPWHWLRWECHVLQNHSPLIASQNLVSSTHNSSELDGWTAYRYPPSKGP